MRPTKRTSEAGFSLLELMIATSIIALVILGTGSVLTTAARQNALVREDIAAMRAARAKIAEIKASNFDSILATYGSGYTFRAQLVRGLNMPLGLEVLGVQQDEGEVVLILDETPGEADYGRDMIPYDTNPDGVDLNNDGSRTGVLNVLDPTNIFPLDINNDGDINDTEAAIRAAPNEIQLMPVVVIIRYRSMTGIERRIELMTVIGRP